MRKYNSKVEIWKINEQEFPYGKNSTDQLKFLLRYAILAPSSHNTQPWKFLVNENKIDLFIDKTRWLKVADPTQRELYISIGCALENLLIAAEYFDYEYEIVYLPDPNKKELAATVKFISPSKPSSFRKVDLFDAIPMRHTNHKAYKNYSVSQDKLQFLLDCCIEKNIFVHIIDNSKNKEKINKLQNRSNKILFSNQAYRKELGHWIGQGVFGTSWIVSKISQLAVTYMDMGKRQAKKDSEILMSAPVIVIISSKGDDKLLYIKVGQVFERIFLKAAKLGINVHPMSQILEVPELKSEISRFTSLSDAFCQHMFRIGYADSEEDYTPRRPVKEVLI